MLWVTFQSLLPLETLLRAGYGQERAEGLCPCSSLLEGFVRYTLPLQGWIQDHIPWPDWTVGQVLDSTPENCVALGLEEPMPVLLTAAPNCGVLYVSTTANPLTSPIGEGLVIPVYFFKGGPHQIA